MDTTILAMGTSLLWSFLWVTTKALLDVPRAVLLSAFSTKPKGARPLKYEQGSCTFYEGEVYHERKRPVRNEFRYPVRMAVLSLDNPPKWFAEQASDHMTADEARKFASTTGPVSLLTHPMAAGYTQNPISVYYCYGADGTLLRCIAEVTNTPWGARVTFVFHPKGESVQKSLHVSPLMDMGNVWHLKATLPGDSLHVSVRVTHPQLGSYFIATLDAVLSTFQLPNESASLSTLLRFGFMPQRLAFWIYWQAAKLLWKGAKFYGPPSNAYRHEVERTATNPCCGKGTHFVWRDAQSYPWNVDQ